jgi:hypothetical protein
MRKQNDGIDVQGKAPGFWFYPADYLRSLAPCSLPARGLWADCLCYMHFAKRRGYLEHPNGNPITAAELARMTGGALSQIERALAELERCGIYSRDESGSIFNRRMVRDTDISDKRRRAASCRLLAAERTVDGTFAPAKQEMCPASYPANVEQNTVPSSSSSSSAKAIPPIPPTADAVGTRKTPLKSKAVLTPDQETWWAKIWPEYWRHEAKTKAREKFAAKVTTKEIANTFWLYIQRNKARMLARDPESRPHMATVLNQARWEDEPDIPAQPKQDNYEADLLRRLEQSNA